MITTDVDSDDFSWEACFEQSEKDLEEEVRKLNDAIELQLTIKNDVRDAVSSALSRATAMQRNEVMELVSTHYPDIALELRMKALRKSPYGMQLIQELTRRNLFATFGVFKKD